MYKSKILPPRTISPNAPRLTRLYFTGSMLSSYVQPIRRYFFSRRIQTISIDSFSFFRQRRSQTPTFVRNSIRPSHTAHAPLNITANFFRTLGSVNGRRTHHNSIIKLMPLTVFFYCIKLVVSRALRSYSRPYRLKLHNATVVFNNPFSFSFRFFVLRPHRLASIYSLSEPKKK